MKYLPYIVIFLIGYFLGRDTTVVHEVERHVKGKTITDTVAVPEPYFVSTPVLPLFFYKADTVRNVQVVDTAAILADWIQQRNYKQTLFDNESGKADINLSVQYNKLTDLSYSFTPIHKEIIRTKEQAWLPFVSASYSGQLGVGGGLFYHNIGVEYQYQFDGHLIGLKYILR